MMHFNAVKTSTFSFIYDVFFAPRVRPKGSVEKEGV